MPLPVTTPQDVNLNRLSPELRRILRQRAHAQARREYAPILEADRAALEAPQAAYRTQAQATRGAASMAENLLLSALGGLKGRGLSGSALNQTRSELTSRIGDAASSVPFLLADAAEERAAGVGEARQQLMQDRGAMLSDSAANFNSLLEKAREAGGSQIEEEKDAQKAARKAAEDEAMTGANGLDISPENLKNAELALKTALTGWAENPEVEGPDGEMVPLKELNPLRTDQDWRLFAQGLVENNEGFGLAAINEIIERIRPAAADARRRREHQGVVPQPGVPGAGSWAAR